jgi:hypothetical protein
MCFCSQTYFVFRIGIWVLSNVHDLMPPVAQLMVRSRYCVLLLRLGIWLALGEPSIQWGSRGPSVMNKVCQSSTTTTTAPCT